MHCVVWAKELYKLLFADPKTSMMYEENVEDSVYMKHVRGLRSLILYHCLVALFALGVSDRVT